MLLRESNSFKGASFFIILLLASLAGSTQAQVEPDRSGLGQAEFRLDELNIEDGFSLPADLPDQAAAQAGNDLKVLGLSANAGRVDVRSGRWATLMLSEPLLPGRGKGNSLSWAGMGGKAPKNDSQLARAADKAFRGYVSAASKELRIDLAEVANPGRVTVHGGGNSIQVYAPRVVNGVPVRGSYLSATINNGNLTLFGANRWGDINTSTTPSISESKALETVQAHVAGYTVDGSWRKSELQLVPLARGQNPKTVQPGRGYDYRLAWVLRPAFDGDMRQFEALVDAHNGELLSFEDTNQYVATERESKGGVYPVSNDGASPDGIEKPGWPMPYDKVSTPAGTVTTDSGGNLPLPVDGNITSNLSGQYVRISDRCGAISLTSAGDVDFGTSGGTDCTTPGFGGAGNTHASRTGYHELNRIIEMGRGQLPGNTWLQQTLTSNMNINQTCNAFWGGGSVNFYRSGGGCFNTGEIAGVFDHEWGHGLDDNDAVPTIASPSGEGIADVYAALRLNSSCIGRHFRSTNCTGFGDACLSCTGVRDIDYLKHASGQPHDYTWSNANCGGTVHCTGLVYSEAVWSLWKRQLQAAPYNYDDDTAHEIVTRLTYIGAGNVGTWYAGGPPNGGCGSNSGYMQYLAADDDNGNLGDGTPHMTAIFNAFNDQEIACPTPTVQDSGCAGTPTSAPVLSGSPLDKSVSLSWGAVAGASGYEVFRTDGVHACDFGKVKVAETTGLTFNDTGLQNGRTYSYVVIPKGPSASCFGPASSCTSVAPQSGPNMVADPASAVLSTLIGDGDNYADNCEDLTLTFDVANNGLGSLSNVRITGVTVISPAGTTILTSFPSPVSPSTLAQGASGSASFDFHAGGLSFGGDLVFQVSFTADEIDPVIKSETFTLSYTESDTQALPSRTWDFESDLEDWSVIQGTFNQTTSGGGAGGSAGYVASSTLLNDQCDQVRSPLLLLSASSTLSLQNNYEIENFSGGQWWDIANVAVYDSDSRDAVSPDGGRLYNASGEGASCVTSGQPGWANVNGTWGGSSWSASALGSASRAGKPVQLDIAYGTDYAVSGKGFWFDKVTLTNFELLIPDTQDDLCDAGGCTLDSECDDGAWCNGSEFCDTGTGTCQPGEAPVCDDGLICNGAETCNESSDTCNAGTPPLVDDGVSCTEDSCDETNGVTHTPNDALCDNGLFCDGAETCDAVNDCQAGTPPVVDDGVSCTNDSCDETNGVTHTPDDALCDNGAYCDGTETCDVVNDCQAGAPIVCPAGEICDEGTDSCVADVCDNDGVCEAGENCNNCANDCISGTIPGAVCGNGVCEAGDGENTATCSADCAGTLNGKPSGRFACGFNDGYLPDGCGDARCNTGGYTCTEIPTGSAGSFCCGDSICEGAENSSSCSLDCGAPPAPVCGNGVLEAGETCDGIDFGGLTCSDYGYAGGSLECSSDCQNVITDACTNDICVPTATKEKGPRCSDGLDNDCDGLIDAADPDC